MQWELCHAEGACPQGTDLLAEAYEEAAALLEELLEEDRLEGGVELIAEVLQQHRVAHLRGTAQGSRERRGRHGRAVGQASRPGVARPA